VRRFDSSYQVRQQIWSGEDRDDGDNAKKDNDTAGAAVTTATYYYYYYSERMDNTRLPKYALNYKPLGRRGRGRLRKRKQRVDAGTCHTT
jgi:hypothetical protein